jgi:hypothetical protein
VKAGVKHRQGSGREPIRWERSHTGVKSLGVIMCGLAMAGAGCSGGSAAKPAAKPASGPTRLRVIVHGINRTKPWHTSFSLRCSPPAGSHPDPRAACQALADLLAKGTVPPRHCDSEMSGPWATVRGTYGGRALSLAYAEACGRGRAGREAQVLGEFFTHGGAVAAT